MTGELDSAVMIGERCEIAPDAELRAPCVIGRDSYVGPEATIERSVLLEGCTVGDGAQLTDSILSAGVTVEPGAELDGVVVGEGERV